MPANGRDDVHLGIRQQPQLLELGRRQQMGLIDHEHDAAVPFGGLGGEQVGGLGHQFGFEVARLGAQGPHDGDVEPAGAERGVGDVDDLVPGRVQPGHGRPDRHRLPGADVAGDDPQRRFRTQKVIRATASAWAWRWNRSAAGIALPNGVRVSPKCAAHGAGLAVAVLVVV